MTSEAAILAADHAARHWNSPQPGRLKPGSAEHRAAVCAMFSETFNPYKPAVIDWPKLEGEALERLTSLPIWDIAVRTEGKARINMATYAETIPDPQMREAIRLNGWEEGRHKEVLSRLVEAYGIRLAPEPPYPAPHDEEWAYLVTGFSECIDSFFAFGLFRLAQQSGFFPEELVETFEPVIQEEARHILLFANWLAWHRASLPWYRRIGFELRVAAVWVFLGWERIGLAREVGKEDAKASSTAAGEKTQDNNFTLNGSKALGETDIGVLSLMALCLTENDRRFAGYDPRLLRPTTMPAIARFVTRFRRKG